MTVRQLLDNLDSVELAEWYILEDFDSWRTKVAEIQSAEPSADFMLSALFGKSIKAGEVVWRDQQQSSKPKS